MKKEVREPAVRGMKLERRDYSRREKTRVRTILLSGGTSAALHCATHAALIRVIRSARHNFEPLVKKGASEMSRYIAGENERKRERERQKESDKEKERERRGSFPVRPRAGVISSYRSTCRTINLPDPFQRGIHSDL